MAEWAMPAIWWWEMEAACSPSPSTPHSWLSTGPGPPSSLGLTMWRPPSLRYVYSGLLLLPLVSTSTLWIRWLQICAGITSVLLTWIKHNDAYINKIAGLLFVPYQAWVTLATFLNYRWTIEYEQIRWLIWRRLYSSVWKLNGDRPEVAQE